VEAVATPGTSVRRKEAAPEAPEAVSNSTVTPTNSGTTSPLPHMLRRRLPRERQLRPSRPKWPTQTRRLRRAASNSARTPTPESWSGRPRQFNCLSRLSRWSLEEGPIPLQGCSQ
jgi:hypothetical protein